MEKQPQIWYAERGRKLRRLATRWCRLRLAWHVHAPPLSHRFYV